MNHIVILCDGAFPRKEYPLYLLESADAVVCCDAAVLKYLRFTRKRYGQERLPEAVIGDFDSLSPAWQKRLSALLIRDSGQEDNDLTKAMRYVLATWPEVEQITILGAGGLREDHTVANLGLLMEYTRLFDLGSRRVEMVSDFGTAFAITDSCQLHLGAGRRISLFSADNSLNIKSTGLQWPTDNVVFDAWWPATLNRTTDDKVTLTLSHPSRVLVFVD